MDVQLHRMAPRNGFAPTDTQGKVPVSGAALNTALVAVKFALASDERGVQVVVLARVPLLW